MTAKPKDSADSAARTSVRGQAAFLHSANTTGAPQAPITNMINRPLTCRNPATSILTTSRFFTSSSFFILSWKVEGSMLGNTLRRSGSASSMKGMTLHWGRIGGELGVRRRGAGQIAVGFEPGWECRHNAACVVVALCESDGNARAMRGRLTRMMIMGTRRNRSAVVRVSWRRSRLRVVAIGVGLHE